MMEPKKIQRSVNHHPQKKMGKKFVEKRKKSLKLKWSNQNVSIWSSSSLIMKGYANNTENGNPNKLQLSLSCYGRKN